MEMQLVFFNLVYIRELLQMLLGIVLYFGIASSFFGCLAAIWLLGIKPFID